MTKKNDEDIVELCRSLVKIGDADEMYRFMKDLTTPAELDAFAERWKVCKLLAKEDMSYREISRVTGSSLTTIGRVARFLKQESYKGYEILLNKIKGE